jgi:hypothetical protein
MSFKRLCDESGKSSDTRVFGRWIIRRNGDQLPPCKCGRTDLIVKNKRVPRHYYTFVPGSRA